MRPTISSTEDGDRALRERSLIDFVPRAVNALPLLRAGALRWLVSAEAPDDGWEERFGVRMYSLEHQQGARRDVRRGRMDSLPDPPPGALDSAASPLLPGSRPDVPRRWAPMVTALPGPAGAHDDLHDKSRMRAWFRDRGVPTPASAVLPAHSLTHAAVARMLGTPFVAQRLVGKGGSGTYLVRDEAELRAARDREPEADSWLVSEFFDGTTLNLHGIVRSDGSVDVTRPSVQLAGLPEVGSEFGAFCGCDFQAPQQLPDIALDRAREAVRRVGSGLAGRHYRGVFGIDLVVRGEYVAVLELNPRMQGSTWLLGEIERSQGHVPLLNRHVLERHGRPTGGAHDPSPAPGVQLGVRHTGPDGELTTAARSGVYALRGNRLLWRRCGVGLLECAGDECVAVGIPPTGQAIKTGGSLGMLVAKRAVTDHEGKVLNDFGTRLVRAFRQLFTISAWEDEGVTR